MSWVRFGMGCALVVAAAVAIAIGFGSREMRRLREQVDVLERERQELRDFALRLTASRRVAQIDVVSSQTGPDGSVVTELLWQEVGSDGVRGRPQPVRTIGDVTHVEALVLKFRTQFVAEGDPERGHSLALFRRVFGSGQASASVPELPFDARIVGSAVGPAGAFRDELFARFWELAENPAEAERMGVRVAQIEAPGVRMRAGQIWQATLDSSGGLNLTLQRTGD